MSISNISGVGEMPANENKLYLVTISCTLNIAAYTTVSVNFNFYSTNKIDTKEKFITFLENFQNDTVGVFGDSYQQSASTVITPVRASYYNRNYFRLYYFSGSYWAISDIPLTSFSVGYKEV